MSVNRENVVWQSEDGTWSRGFYDFYDTKDYDDEGYDYEWDVDYEYDSFRWVSCGHATKEQARASWDGANPGGSATVAYGDTSPGGEMLAPKFDEMAVACAARGGYASGVDPKKVADYKDRALISRFYFTQRSFDKNGKPSEFFAADDARELKELQGLIARRPELAGYARECREKVAEAGERRVEEARKRERYTPSYSYSARSSGVGSQMTQAKASLEFVDRLKLPAVVAANDSTSAESPSRRKTTAASTAGSFAPKVGSAPTVTL